MLIKFDSDDPFAFAQRNMAATEQAAKCKGIQMHEYNR